MRHLLELLILKLIMLIDKVYNRTDDEDFYKLELVFVVMESSGCLSRKGFETNSEFGNEIREK